MKSFKLNTDEEKALFDTSMKINKELVKMGKMPLTESKIMHEILNQTLILGELEIKTNGDIRVIVNN